MDRLKEILKLPLVLRQVNYDYKKLAIVPIDTNSTITIWAISHNDTIDKSFAIKFGPRIFTNRQRVYPQVKNKLLKVLTVMKIEKKLLNYS